jgi:aminocarboxymuconate-semialdehyde decarboxylase
MQEPLRLYGLGIVPLQDVDLAVRELADVRRLGLRGVEILAHVNGVSLGDARFGDFFVEAERLGLAIFVHGMTPVAPERLGPGTSATFGVAEDITVAAIALLSHGILARCPTLRIALSHGGGGFPLMLPRAHYFWSGSWNEGPRLPTAMGGGYALPLSPTEYARRFFYDTLVFDRRVIRYLRDMLGADRLLVGTDHPAMVRESPVGATLRSVGLSEAEVAAVSEYNARAYLGLDL